MNTPVQNYGRLVLVIAATLFLAQICTGCRRNQETAKSQPTIALVMKTLNNPFFVDMERGAREAAQRLRVDLVVQAAEREVDAEKQMQIIENLIERRVEAICVTPSGSKEIVPAIVKANRAGIPVLIVDTRVDAAALSAAAGRTTCFIGSDNAEGGRLAGRYLVQRLQGKGKLAILEGIPGHETGDARLRGFREVVDRQAGLQVVASQTANWERDQGFNVFQNLFQSHPEIQGVFACNDLMALGAMEAIAAAGKTGAVVLVGFDATSDAREAIQKGTLAGSVAQHPEEMGRLAVEQALAAIRGQPVPAEVSTRMEMITKDKP